jgi:hypothetical protein
MYGVDPEPAKKILDFFEKKIDVAIDTVYIPVFVGFDSTPIISTQCYEGNRLTLRWAHSPSPDAAGYTVYSGNFPGVYTTTHNCTENTFTSDPIYKDTYFALACYDSSGNVSARGAELFVECVRCESAE